MEKWFRSLISSSLDHPTSCRVVVFRISMQILLLSHTNTTVSQGYLGFNMIPQVFQVIGYASSPYPLWFMYYEGGPGIKSFLKAHGYQLFPASPSVGVTQICINCT